MNTIPTIPVVRNHKSLIDLCLHKTTAATVQNSKLKADIIDYFLDLRNEEVLYLKKRILTQTYELFVWTVLGTFLAKIPDERRDIELNYLFENIDNYEKLIKSVGVKEASLNVEKNPD